MRLIDLSRSSVARLATAYALLNGLSLAILLAFLLAFVNHDTREQTRESIQQDVRELTRIYLSGGQKELEDNLRILSKSIEADRSLYLLEDSAGQVIAGSDKRIEPFSGWLEISLPRSSKRPDPFLVFAAPLGNLILFVGRRTHTEREVRQSVLHSFGLAISLVVPISVAVGLYLGRKAFRRVDQITEVMRTFAGGQLARRVPMTGQGDEIDRLADNINAALQKIEMLLTSLRQIATDIAHDLRTPLGRLRQRLETVSGKLEFDPGFIQTAIDDVDGILATFDSLLHIAEIDAGVARARFAEIDLSRCAQEIYDVYSSVAEDNQHSLEFRGAAAVVLGDRGLLIQLLANLVENAIRHTPDGTAIALSVSQNAGRVSLVVADNGPGIAEHERERVFRRFFRLEQSRTTPGSGLGLTLVKAICELHNARIELGDNAPGLIVKIDFPAAC